MPLTYVEVDLSAIADNMRTFKAHVGPSVSVMAVVKANAYGHGAVPVAQTALLHGADRLAVARVGEGVELREAGITAPVLVLGYAMPDEVRAAIAHDLTLSIIEVDVARLASAEAVARRKTVPMHVKLDTGMGRFGLLPDEIVPFLDAIAALPGLHLEGLYTHFAVADAADKAYTRQQFEQYRQALKAAQAAGHRFGLRHVANSAATLDLPDMHLNAVRIGIALYGLWPSNEVAPVLALRPALALKSHLARVRTLPGGVSISYGRTFTTPCAMPVGLVPVGYGDGYQRLLSNRGQVLVNGRRAPIIGRVCMDQFVIDLSDVGPVARNDEVVLIGMQGVARITAEEIAGWAETINYEVTTGLLPRVPRRYLAARPTGTRASE
ncbi:MAG: alanine racemase [Anaerolineae bacterium]|nr:alanine racemase [Anaerolineae bacterium]